MRDLARDVKSGKQKLEDVPAGIRKQVQRMLPDVGTAPTPVPADRGARLTQGPHLRSYRQA